MLRFPAMTRALASLVAVCLSGCATGGMGQSTIQEGHGAGKRALNAPIAVGAVLVPEVVVETPGGSAPVHQLFSVRPDVVEARGNELVGKSPGVSAILIREQSGIVIDLLHISVAKASHLSLHRLTVDGTDLGELREDVELLVGDAIVLSPRVYAGPQRLTGSAASDWRVDPPEVARVLKDGVPDRRRVVAAAPGTATLSIETLGQRVSVRLSVLAGGAS